MVQHSRRPGPLDVPLLTQEYGTVVDLSWLAPDQRTYECTGSPVILTSIDGLIEVIKPCGWLLPAGGFRPMPTYVTPYGVTQQRARPVRPMCVTCEEKIRTAKNRLNFWGYRMERSCKSHYYKEGPPTAHYPRREGLHAAPTFADYLRLTGLDLCELTKRARESADTDGPCQHCQKLWSQFPGGAVMHLTLDRRDIGRLLTMDNYAFICRTGNSQYGRVDPRSRTIRDAIYRIKAERGAL